MEDVYGTEFESENGLYTELSSLMTDQKKVDVIQNIISNYRKNNEMIVYFGDGLTDKHAFSYVHSIDGKTVFITKDGEDNKNYQELKNLGIIDKCLLRILVRILCCMNILNF